MLDRLILVGLAPLALAGGAASTWFESRSTPDFDQDEAVSAPRPQTGAGDLSVTKGPDGLLHTVVRINDVPVSMIIDTGANRSILSEEDAERVAIAPAQPELVKIRTLGGDKDLLLHRAESVEISGRRFTGLKVGQIEGSAVSIIGLDWLRLAGPLTISAD